MKKFEKPIYVIRPLLPSLKEVNREIKEIWDSKWVTNMGKKHNELQERLKSILGVPNVSLFNNGTIALLVAIQALELPEGSEVITTPFTFAASPHCITWNRLKPVFCDINSETMCIDVNKIESLITPNTSAILGVHVYGFPCDVYKIQKIADKHNLKVIYDGAHAFTTKVDGKSIGTFGDITMYSFHATKLFNTIEGGCLTYNDNKLKDKIYLLRNFGIKNEFEVVDCGINGKMNEIQASIGLLNLKLYKEEQRKRQKIFDTYIENLKNIEGIKLMNFPKNCTKSLQYFLIRINKEKFGISRDELYEKLKEYNVFARKYFAPICSEYNCYKDLPSSCVKNLPVVNKIKSQVLCLPFYGGLGVENAKKIVEIISYLKR